MACPRISFRVHAFVQIAPGLPPLRVFFQKSQSNPSFAHIITQVILVLTPLLAIPLGANRNVDRAIWLRATNDGSVEESPCIIPNLKRRNTLHAIAFWRATFGLEEVDRMTGGTDEERRATTTRRFRPTVTL